jgi:hypothetical protein
MTGKNIMVQKNYNNFIIFTVFLFVTILAGGCIQQEKLTNNSSQNNNITSLSEAKIIPPNMTVNVSSDDKQFLDAMNICYQEIPAITNITTHITFVKCMQNTPVPSDPCAQNFRTYSLKYMNDDDTSSGYSRMTQNMHISRQEYYKHMQWNITKVRFEPCAD